MRPSWGIIGWIPLLLLTACVASHTAERTGVRSSPFMPGPERPALDRLLATGDIHVAQGRLRTLGVDPGAVDGMYTAQVKTVVRAFQARYGLPGSGLLDRATREQLKLRVDLKRTD
jgi:peptidoglycan hydrolase-like protein with peptidoglycan-binding domain